MLPVAALLSTAVLARSPPDNDDKISFAIARAVRADGNFEKFFNTTDHSLFLTKLNDRKVVIVSEKLSGIRSAAILRLTTVPHLRFGVEWARNQSFINGKRDGNGRRYGADTFHAVRFIGMHEVNDDVKTLSPQAAKYRFEDFNWSGFTATTTTIDGSRTINLNTSATSGGLTFTFVMHVSDTPNVTLGINPFGIKYDIHISGNPVYNLQNSHYRFINLIHNSQIAYNSLNGTSIDFGTTSYNWVSNVTVDGIPSTLNSSGIINQTTSDEDTRWMMVARGLDHESNLDYYSSKVILGFDIPKFTSSFSWDPTIMVDNEKANQEYQASSASKFSQSASLAFVFASILFL